MLQIHNDIDKHIVVTFFCDGNKVGQCTNALAFFDALCQIKQEGSDKYTCSSKATLPNGDTRTFMFNITPNGRLAPVATKHLTLWNDILCTQMLYLEGFKPDFFYDKK